MADNMLKHGWPGRVGNVSAISRVTFATEDICIAPLKHPVYVACEYCGNQQSLRDQCYGCGANLKPKEQRARA